MKIILSEDDLKNHVVNKYSFKSLNINVDKQIDVAQENISVASQEDINNTVEKSEVNETLHEIQQQNESFSESLLKKIDELSTSLVKMEMRLEKQQDEFSQRLEEEKTNSFEDGLKEGKEQMQKELELEIEVQKKQIIESIQKMHEATESFDNVSKNLEKELVDAAIDIAKEVINTQVDKHSQEIALNLAKTLIDDVKGAMNIKIKANPQDCDYLKEGIKQSNIEIVADNAVSRGGIIIQSDAGNVDGSVMKRFQAIKQNILEN